MSSPIVTAKEVLLQYLHEAVNMPVNGLTVAEAAPVPPPSPPGWQNYDWNYPLLQTVLAGKLEVQHARDGETHAAVLSPGASLWHLPGGWDARPLKGSRRLLTVGLLPGRLYFFASRRAAADMPESAPHWSLVIDVETNAPAWALGQALNACVANVAARATAATLLPAFYTLLQQALAADRPQHQGQAARVWTGVTVYLRGHLAAMLDCAATARRFGYSPDYLGRLCKQQTGRSFPQFLQELRMEKAERLLTSRPELSLKELARECGYAEANYLIKVYKKRFGRTPKERRGDRQR